MRRGRATRRSESRTRPSCSRGVGRGRSRQGHERGVGTDRDAGRKGNGGRAQRPAEQPQAGVIGEFVLGRGPLWRRSMGDVFL